MSPNTQWDGSKAAACGSLSPAVRRIPKMVIKQSRPKHTQTFAECLAEEAARFRKAAEEAPPGMTRELLLRRVRLAEAAYMNNRLKSPGAQRQR